MAAQAAKNISADPTISALRRANRRKRSCMKLARCTPRATLTGTPRAIVALSGTVRLAISSRQVLLLTFGARSSQSGGGGAAAQCSLQSTHARKQDPQNEEDGEERAR